MQLKVDNKITLTGAPHQLETELQQVFTLRNPIFEEATKRGRYALHIPQFLRFCETTESGLICPRGAARSVLDMAKKHGSVEIIDRRLSLPKVDLNFHGALRPYQQQAVAGVLSKDFGVLEATTGSGKTIMALAIIAARKQPTLILVHSKELLYQWRDRIKQFLGVEAGLIGDSKFDVLPVTVGVINTVRNRLDCLAERFGHIVTDECHRTPSTTFSEALRVFPSKYMLGLSATPYRRDKLTQLIRWYCGQHRVTVDRSALYQVGAVLRPEIVTRKTGFQYLYADDYSKMITALVIDNNRNNLIAGDIHRQAKKGGISLVVSDRTAHLQTLADIANVDGSRILTGKTSTIQRRKIVEQLADGEVSVLFSTLSLIGEGFDCPSMDSLFITTPVKFSGRLKQVVGRVLRPADGKQPLVFDYVDAQVGLLAHQANHRGRVFAELQQS